MLHSFRNTYNASNTGDITIFNANEHKRLLIKDIAVSGEGGAKASLVVIKNSTRITVAPTNYVGKRELLLEKDEALKLSIWQVGVQWM